MNVEKFGYLTRAEKKKVILYNLVQIIFGSALFTALFLIPLLLLYITMSIMMGFDLYFYNAIIVRLIILLGCILWVMFAIYISISFIEQHTKLEDLVELTKRKINDISSGLSDHEKSTLDNYLDSLLENDLKDEYVVVFAPFMVSKAKDKISKELMAGILASCDNHKINKANYSK